MATSPGQQQEVIALPVLASEPSMLEAYKQLVARTISVFGDALTASRWLSTPSMDFNGEVPLQVAQREGYSLARFEPIFARIEHGIYV